MAGKHRDDSWAPGDENLLQLSADEFAVTLAALTFISLLGLLIFNVARSTHWSLALALTALIAVAVGLNRGWFGSAHGGPRHAA